MDVVIAVPVFKLKPNLWVIASSKRFFEYKF